MTNMKRWSDAKLDKELTFALAAKDDGHAGNLEWLASVQAEAERRDVAAELAGIQSVADRV